MTLEQARWMRIVARWHRWLALCVLAWLAVLAISGVMVNHANDWGLDRQALSEPLQRLAYGEPAKREDYCKAFPTIGPNCRAVFGQLNVSGGVVLLAAHSLMLLDDGGRLVETMPIGQAGLQKLASGFASNETVYLSDGLRTVVTGPDLLDFSPPGAEQSAILENAAWKQQAPGVADITWERFFLDLHAGRFLGSAAKIFNDVVAAMILLLVASGFWLHRMKRRTG